MSVADTREAGKKGVGWTAPARVLRLEKSSKPGNDRDEERSSAQVRPQHDTKPSQRDMSHFDTAGHVSPWNGPVLASPFAAQVIAQALNVHEDAATSARRAYRHGAQTGRPFLFDDRV